MLENNLIKIEVKRSYGVERFYVTGEHKKAVQALTRKATVDFQDLQSLSDLGFKLDIQHNLEHDPLRQLVDNLNERRN